MQDDGQVQVGTGLVVAAIGSVAVAMSDMPQREKAIGWAAMACLAAGPVLGMPRSAIIAYNGLLAAGLIVRWRSAPS